MLMFHGCKLVAEKVCIMFRPTTAENTYFGARSLDFPDGP